MQDTPAYPVMAKGEAAVAELEGRGLGSFAREGEPEYIPAYWIDLAFDGRHQTRAQSAFASGPENGI